jgi:hypothetical protein
MIISTTVFAVNLLGSHNLRGHAIGMMQLALAVACFDVPGIDSQEFQVLSLVVKIFLETLQKGGQESLGEPLDHVVGIDYEDGSWPFTEAALLFLAVLLQHVFLKFLTFPLGEASVSREDVAVLIDLRRVAFHSWTLDIGCELALLWLSLLFLFSCGWDIFIFGKWVFGKILIQNHSVSSRVIGGNLGVLRQAVIVLKRSIIGILIWRRNLLGPLDVIGVVGSPAFMEVFEVLLLNSLDAFASFINQNIVILIRLRSFLLFSSVLELFTREDQAVLASGCGVLLFLLSLLGLLVI